MRTGHLNHCVDDCADAPSTELLNSQFLRPTANGRIAFSLRLLVKLQFQADILLADQNHLSTAYRTDLLFFRKRDPNSFNLQTFEEFLIGCLLFTGMFPDHSFFFQQGWILFYFRFIEEILLPRNIIGSSFAGRAEIFLSKIVYLFLECLLVT